MRFERLDNALVRSRLKYQMTNFLLLFQGGFGALTGLLPMVLIIAVFYLLLIRPAAEAAT